AELRQGTECLPDVLRRVDRAQPREDVERVLGEVNAVVLESDGLEAAVVAADGAKRLGHAHDLLHRLELLEWRRRHDTRGPKQIDLGHRSAPAIDAMDLLRDSGIALGHAA